jgi:O-antigen/teichoic acid export membrane protein
MRELRVTFRHSRTYAAASVLNRTATFLLLPLYARCLSPADYGLLGLISVASEVAGTAIGLGLGVALSRIYFDYSEPRDRDEVVTSAMLGYGTVALVTALPLALLAEPLGRVLFGAPGHGSPLLLGMLGLLANGLFTLGLQYLRVGQRSRAYMAVSTLRSLGLLVANGALVGGLGWGVMGALAGTLVVNALFAASLLATTLARLGSRFSTAKFRALLAFGLPSLPGSLADFATGFIDRYLLVHLTSLAAGGVYFLAVRVATMLYVTLIAPFGQIYAIRRLEIHAARASDPEAAPLFTYFFVAMVSGALALALLAPEIVVLLASRGYGGAAVVIPFLALAQVINSLLLILQTGIYFAKRPRRLTVISVATLGLHAAAAPVLISTYGALGAAAAGVLSATFRAGLTTRLAVDLGGPRPEWARLTVILLAAAAILAIDRSLGFTPSIPLLALHLVVSAAFPVLVLLSPLFASGERAALRSLLQLRARLARPQAGAA